MLGTYLAALYVRVGGGGRGETPLRSSLTPLATQRFCCRHVQTFGPHKLLRSGGHSGGLQKLRSFDGVNTAIRLDAAHGIKACIVPAHTLGSYEYPATVGRCRLNTATEESHIFGRKKQVPGPLVEKFYQGTLSEKLWR